MLELAAEKGAVKIITQAIQNNKYDEDFNQKCKNLLRFLG